MRRSLRVVARAERQIRSASDWWTENRRAAPDLFRDELEHAFQLITAQPDVGALALDVGLEGVRRIHLSRVRYHLYYRVRGEERRAWRSLPSGTRAAAAALPLREAPLET